MVEGAALEKQCARNRTVGSNPTLSAIYLLYIESAMGIIEKYHQYLDIPKLDKIITLEEGNTPLIQVPNIAKKISGGFKLYVKYEGLNPTGSFKDRGMVIAVNMAVANNSKAIICASTGNTAASAAAYAARSGLKSIVIIPKGKVAKGKLVASYIYGAEVVQISESFDKALDLVKELSQELPVTLVNSLNPYRIEGQKTAAFEVCDQLSDSPDILFLPVGNAGNITAYFKGFEDYQRSKKYKIPVFIGVQAEGAAPLVRKKDIDDPETVATAIRIGKPARRVEAEEVVKATNGQFVAVTDKQILQAQKILASEGIWVEPASAAGLAGLLKNKERYDLDGKTGVIVCTGHGMKDPDIIDLPPINVVSPSVKNIKKLIS